MNHLKEDPQTIRNRIGTLDRELSLMLPSKEPYELYLQKCIQIGNLRRSVTGNIIRNFGVEAPPEDE